MLVLSVKQEKADNKNAHSTKEKQSHFLKDSIAGLANLKSVLLNVVNPLLFPKPEIFKI